ncbi:hypothetical protein PanWU01x14_056030 [Parasponia andersonii]|uniref:Uncharacterized protein n=1 Tax=Parasponia andersonii TaxID=3476 RepID=A0A2P5DKE4_PARAD|nr:hypothetical protein PanWU01x14_056030 [Parasponia andersonii]
MKRGSNKTTCRLTFLLKPEPCDEGRIPRGKKCFWIAQKSRRIGLRVETWFPSTSP